MVDISFSNFQRWIKFHSAGRHIFRGLFFLIFLISISIFFSSCKNTDRIDEIKKGYFFELVDSVKVDIPYEFGLVSPKMIDGHLLAYSYLDQTFHLLDSMGKIQKSIKQQGEGPKEYSEILFFVTIHDGHIIFMDDKKLTYINFLGEWVKSIPYNDPNFSRRGGIPYNDIYFVDKNSFVVPSVHLDDLGFREDYHAVLDTIPIWFHYRYSSVTDEFEIDSHGRLDTSSMLFSQLKFNNYKPRIFLDKGVVSTYFHLFPTIYKYKIGESNFPISKKKVLIQDFKKPIGLDYKSITFENHMEFNRAAEINSTLSYVVSIEDNRLFFIYGQGKNINMYDSDADADEAQESLFFGFIEDFEDGNESRIELPKHHGHPSFGRGISYLGENRFLFIYENEVERDFCWGKIFELKPISK